MALYLYVLPLNPWVSLAVVIVLAILTFVPTRHLYPSQPGTLNQVTTILGVIWAPLLAWVIWRLPTGSQTRPSESTLWLAYLIASLSALLPGRVVGDQCEPLAEAGASRVSRRRNGAANRCRRPYPRSVNLSVMGRPHRAAQGGLIYHTLNGANAGLAIFEDEDDFAAFGRIDARLSALLPEHVVGDQRVSTGGKQGGKPRDSLQVGRPASRRVPPASRRVPHLATYFKRAPRR